MSSHSLISELILSGLGIETEEHQADTEDLTSSSKFSDTCVQTLQTHLSRPELRELTTGGVPIIQSSLWSVGNEFP